ncbi:EAL and HDOD domain-containing protein [Clostridium gasigenes]|uniref:EAL and modified HD-GYP domain-containing signal transduction protein n=1 Tax=Clostridium gasigenes TaxID=94869 RepID=A0A1H0S8F5_9CLOT|nr:HDOD domain-containing protein [Clostridium gasigenes]MBB6622780.1 HDOD domain-containing protein [Clostridium gasigenes]MBU3089463.1 HDOD domain-containing protein [Clostridium gasigenes]SDP38053.1 EAL and modified HD-GYP domain-containing signal transduction protein [Clostridium gasigenes]
MKIFLARQAIYNKNTKIVAYEILYRNSLKNTFDKNQKQEEATYKVMQNISSFGLNILTKNKLAFINFPEEVINSNMATLLPPDKVIIEVLETVEPTKEIIANLKFLRHKGYTIALDDISTYKQVEGFLGVIDIVKIDYKLSNKAERINIIKKLKNKNIKMLAEKIETENEMIEAKILGFDYFQGYYFSKPTVMESEDIAAKNRTIFYVIIELMKEDYDINRMENLIKSDIGLTYKFIKFINSAYFSFIQEVSSIKNAVMLIGANELRKWLCIISISEMNSNIGEEHANNIIIRARMCELISENKGYNDKDLAFMVGLFSDIHMLMDKSLIDVVEELPIGKEGKAALLGEDNIYSDILNLVIAYENMDEEKIQIISSKTKVNIDKLGEIYLASIEWGSKLLNINR